MTQEPIFDKQDQLEKIQATLIEGEQLRAVFDMKGGGTGFLGITDKRLIFYDKAFMRKSKAMVTVPYSRIIAIASKDPGGLFGSLSSELTIRTSGEAYEFEFRGGEKAHQAYNLIVPQIL